MEQCLPFRLFQEAKLFCSTFRDFEAYLRPCFVDFLTFLLRALAKASQPAGRQGSRLKLIVVVLCSPASRLQRCVGLNVICNIRVSLCLILESASLNIMEANHTRDCGFIADLKFLATDKYSNLSKPTKVCNRARTEVA